MSSDKSSISKRNTNPFCFGRKRKRKSQSKRKLTFSQEKKKKLADSDRGSWFNQEKQWPDEHARTAESTDSSYSSNVSSSKRKLEESRKRFEWDSSNKEFSDTSDDSDWESNSENENDGEDGFYFPKGNHIVSTLNIQALLDSSASCKDCFKKASLKIVEKSNARHGWGTQWMLQCSNSKCRSHEFRRPMPISKKAGHVFEVNRAAVLAFRAIGKGQSAAKKFASVMDLPIPVYKWKNHTQCLETHAKDLLEENCREAVRELKEFKRSTGKIDCCSDEELSNTVVDLAAKFDCSWSSRGWSARDGVVAAISADTGKVLDVVFKTNSCPECTEMENKRKGDEVTRMEFLEWYLKHEPNCYLNHEGSSQSMEASGVLALYKRSLEKHNLRYTTFIGDGDSSSYNKVTIEQPYGPSVFVKKEECVSHVTIRMGTNLRGLIRDYKGRKLEDGKGLGGAGRLTIARIDAMQSFYGLAIRENKGDRTAMAKATQAILYHYASTPEKPQHQHCPTGKSSWCSYQRDIATGKQTHQPIKNPLPPAVLKVVKPVFDRLGDKKFLAGCEGCETQNQNESLHHVIWSFAPKDQYTSAAENGLAVSLGVLVFNSGVDITYSQLIPMVGLSVTPTMRHAWQRIDNLRIYSAEYKSIPEVEMRRRQYRRAKAKKVDAFVHAKSTQHTQYKSQAFRAGDKGKGRGRGRGRGKSGGKTRNK